MRRLALLMVLVFPCVASGQTAGWADSESFPGWQMLLDSKGGVTQWYRPSTGEYQVWDGIKYRSQPAPRDWLRNKTRSEIEPQVDRAEIIRMGNSVQHVRDGLIAEGQDNVFGPPPSDSHKWFISVITMKQCGACVKLKNDWKQTDALRAFAIPDDDANSWCHFHYYDKDDQSQQWRQSKIKVTAYPTIIVQPPRKQVGTDANGQPVYVYGDPKTVVLQTTYNGSPTKLADEIRSAIKRYVAALLPKKTESVEEPIGTDPPWTPKPKVDDAVNPNVLPPDPNAKPTVPPDEPDAPSPAIDKVNDYLPLAAAAAAVGGLLYLPQITAAAKKKGWIKS